MRISGVQPQPSISSYKRSDFNFPLGSETGQFEVNIDLDSARREELEKLAGNYNKTLKESGTELKVSIHQKTRSIIVKIIDIQTEEVIKEIPPEKMLDLVYSLCQNLGIFVDEKR